MYLLIILLPLISALTAGLFGRFIGREGAKWITTSSIFITFLMTKTNKNPIGVFDIHLFWNPKSDYLRTNRFPTVYLKHSKAVYCGVPCTKK